MKLQVLSQYLHIYITELTQLFITIYSHIEGWVTKVCLSSGQAACLIASTK